MSEENIKNIYKVFSQVNEIDYTEGKSAYRKYNVSLQRIASHYKFGFAQTVAAFVSLSPNNDYKGNVRSLVSLLDGINKGQPPGLIRTGTYRHCLKRAYRYATGESDFLLETSGPKIRNFYCSILKPESNKYITIDGHMHNIWFGKKRVMKLALVARKQYEIISIDFRYVARRELLKPCQLQAVLWFTWKRINNILFDSQLCVFNEEGDTWGLKLDPKHIMPYE